MIKLILASASPRRSELLTKVGYVFEVFPSNAPEEVTSAEPSLVVEELSKIKARDIFGKMLSAGSGAEDFIVLGADTVVASENGIMGKPADMDHAFEMLKSLQGRWHSVYTGVTLCGWINGMETEESFHVQTKVKFYSLSNEDILEYLRNPEYKDKAGAYGIQGLGTLLVEKIDGDYNNVVGLPVASVHRHLKQMIQTGNKKEL